MNFGDLHSEVNDMQTELDKMMAEFQDKMKLKFSALTAKFFEETPRCTAIAWTQYTPYFNDGDECTFSLNDIYFTGGDISDLSITELAHGESDNLIDISASEKLIADYERYHSKHGGSYYIKRISEMKEALANDDGTMEKCSKMSSFLSGQSDLLRAIFGDHIVVCLTADAATTQEYDHD